MNTRTTLAIDAGQTGVRTCLTTPGGAVAREFPGVVTSRPVIDQLAEIAASALPDDSGPAALLVGASGITETDTAQGLLGLLEGTPLTEVRMAHDSVTSYLGALGDVAGAVVAAGTGVVTFGVGRTNTARVDGWGHLLGDAGSGYWIGRAGLDAVLRAHDGRGPRTALTDAVLGEFDDLESAYIELQGDPRRVGRIASWARIVADLAETDDVCRRICAAAGRELAHSVGAALRRVGEDRQPEPRVCTTGNVFRGAAVREEFAAALREVFPRARIEPRRGDALHGAQALLRLGGDSPLWRRVTVAGL